MAKKATCRCKQVECEECPEWIFTFADLVMLMMGFFVILWVLKPNANPKASAAEGSASDWLKAAASIREAFGYVPNPNSKDPVDMQMMLRKLQVMKTPSGPGDGAKTLIKQDGAIGTDPEVTTIRVGKQSVVGGRLIFDVGDAKITQSMVKMLDQVADQIRGHRNIVLVKGHTSLDDFDDTATAEAKMDLSVRRAQAVADYLTTHGVEPDILRVQGCSTFGPVVQHEYTVVSQSFNRRVEVESTPTLVGALQQSSNKSPPGTVESQIKTDSQNP